MSDKRNIDDNKKVVPLKGMNVDLSELYISELQAVFIKNWTANTNNNPRSVTGEGGNMAAFTPLQSNRTYSNLVMPPGKNYCIGYYYSKKVKQGYVFVWNQTDKHFIYRITAAGVCEVIYQKACLNFQLDPRHFIREGRVEVVQTTYFDKSMQQLVSRTFLGFCDYYNENRLICEEDSIATNSFDPVANPGLSVAGGASCDCSFISLAVQPPLKCPLWESVPNDPADKRQNKLAYKATQWRIRYIDIWGRPSQWGPISDMFLPSVGGGCVSESSGLPRCVKVSFNAGCAFVDKIEIAFKNWTGSVRGMPTASDWYLYDTIEKWDNCNKVHWWERVPNAALQFNSTTGLGYEAATNTLHYKFCGDKECAPIDVNETNILNNSAPKRSSTLFGIGSGFGLGRNDNNFEPLDCTELAKLNFTIEKPQATTCGVTQLRTIKVWGVIYSWFDDHAVPIIKDDKGGIIFASANCSKNNAYAYDQLLPNDQEGIIGYLVGVKGGYCVSKQYRYDKQTGTLTNTGLDIYQGINLQVDGFDRYIPIQLWEFKVLPGTYVFRVASHKSTPQDDYAKTSTYVVGETDLNSVGTLVGAQKKEWIIGACNGDIELKANPVMIYDLTRDGKDCGDATSVNAGYIYEDEVNGRPIELARVDPNDAVINSYYTDHNGFYWAATRKRGLRTDLVGVKNCVRNQVLATSRQSWDTSDAWYRFDKLYAYHGTNTYLSKDRWVVQGQVSLCSDPTVGVGGVLVVMTNGPYAVTDNNGIFRIAAHDYPDSATPRGELLIYSQRGQCHLYTCAAWGCDYCFNSPYVTAQWPCRDNRVTYAPALNVNVRGLGKKGPANGGRYGGALMLHYPYGRVTYAQMMEKHYFDIPSSWEIGMFDFCKIAFNMTGIQLPQDCIGVSFLVTDNLNWDDSITWVAERVQFIDNTGQVNLSAPSQVRLYYEGLGEYNLQNAEATTTQWEVLTNDKGRTGDIVEFICNGDGTFFTKSVTGLVRYNKEGRYLLIDYSDDLRDLKDGCLIKLIRPKQCENKEFFYEVCPVIAVSGGVPEQVSGYLNYYDSYFMSRSIPIPAEVKKKDKDANGNEIITSVTEIKLQQFPFLFEHHSPSDFWGDHCRIRGRVNVKNPYEKETLNVSQLILSAAFSEKSSYNGLGTYLPGEIISFEEQGFGGIVLVFVENTKVIVVCELDTFAVGYNDNRIRVNSSGDVESISLPGRMGKPQAGSGERYGCALADVNTICRFNGFVVFLDRANGGTLVKHDGGKGEDLSRKIGFSSYLTRKIKSVSQSPTMYFHAGIDPYGQYHLTNAYISARAPDYVNNEPNLYIGAPETLIVHTLEEIFTMASFTPEYYGAMGAEGTDKQLFTFRFGQAWAHYQGGNPTTFNTFYGQKCDRVMELVFGGKERDLYNFLSLRIDCKEHLFNADRILTSSGQLSRIMKSFWTRFLKYSAADFKCAVNTTPNPNQLPQTTVNALLDGELLYGKWVRVRLIGEASAIDKYAELYGVTAYFDTPDSDKEQ